MDRSTKSDIMNLPVAATVFVVNLAALAVTMGPMTNNVFGKLLYLGNVVVLAITGVIMAMQVLRLLSGKYNAVYEARFEERLTHLEGLLRDSAVEDADILAEAIPLINDFPTDERGMSLVAAYVSAHRPHLLNDLNAHFAHLS
jgi:hypothetical protein